MASPAIRIIRPGNCLMAALGVLVGAAVATFGVWPTAMYFAVLEQARLEVWLLAPLAAAFVTASGNILNDIVDIDVDRVAHPARPLPAEAMSLRGAAIEAAALGMAGLAVAWWAGGPSLLAFAAANAGLIVFYEGFAKHRVLVGNVVVAWLVASTVLFGAYAWGGRLGLEAAMPLAGMAGLTNMGREILKDMEDQEADAATRRTVAHALGAGAWWVAAAAVAAAVAYSAVDTVPVATWMWLIPAWSLFVGGTVWAWRSPGRGQRVLKVAMLFAMAAYLAPGLARTLA